ncbi:MAG: hypothetical protein KKB34_13295 [Bacteroidetes bacterium]|nr:hypothetical protein [Bacteroidota bacterium]
MTQIIDSTKKFILPTERKEYKPSGVKDLSKTELEKQELLQKRIIIKDEIVIQDRKWVATEIWLG